MRLFRFIAKINMSIVNFIFSLMVLTFWAYDLIERKRYLNLTALLVILILIIGINVAVSVLKKKAAVRNIKNLAFYRNAKSNGFREGNVGDFQLPLLFLTEKGNVLWYNKNFELIFSDKRLIKPTIKEIFFLRVKGRLAADEPDLFFEAEIEDRTFHVYYHIINAEKRGKEDLLSVMLCFVEVTDFVRLQERYQEQRVAVGELVIDSYEEIYQSSGEAVINQITVELGKIFEKWLADHNAVVRKMVRDRYLLLIEDKYLKDLEKNKFTVLDSAKKIAAGNKIPVTLSIGISAHGASVQENYKNAAAAVDLALSRGGDQAIIRIGGKDTYYGGSNIEMERRTKVKARVISNLLKEELDKSSRVLIMGHSNCDMDALGSCLAVYRAACLIHKKANIILNNENQSIHAMMNKLNSMSEYEDVFINTSYALNLIDDNTLVVVVDTYRQGLTESPKVLDYAARIAVIDHHRRGADYIRDTVLDYSETYASSTSELLIEILTYFKPNLSIPTVEAEALYAGILVDTKNFTFKTGIRTFEAASFLRGQGVDTISVRQYFQPDYATFSKVCEVTGSSRIVAGNIAIAKCGPHIKNPKFIAALSADQMLGVSGIDASFVLAEDGGGIAISGRSLGEINVQVILERMGGGGHLTAAGAALPDVSMDYAEKLLIKNIEDYLNN